jgi:signal transduction histidine kinase
LEPLPAVTGDANQLQQVLTNLVANARDAVEGYQEAKIRITTRARWRGQIVVARILDTGPGIPLEIRKSIFRSFFTTKSPDKGTGLGLSISRRIVENHGGRLNAWSRPGEGACFWLVFPSAGVPASSSAGGDSLGLGEKRAA